MGDRQMNPDFIEQPLPEGGMTPEEAKDIAVDRNRRLQEARGEVKAIQRRIKEFGEQARDELAKKDLKAWREKVQQLEQEKSKIAKMPAALVVTEYGTKAPDTFVLYRGNPHAETSPELLVEPAFPSVLKAVAPVIEPPENGRSTGRRLALAKWIVSADNPLTARVLQIVSGSTTSVVELSAAQVTLASPAILPPIRSCLIGWRQSCFEKTGTSKICRKQ